MRMLGDNVRGVGSIWGMSGKKLGDAGETMENFRKERDEIRGEHNVRGVGSIWDMSGKKLGDAGENMENFRKEVDEIKGEHVKLNILCGLLDKDLVRVEKALDNLTGKMKLEKTVAEQAQKLEAQGKELEELRRILEELRKRDGA